MVVTEAVSVAVIALTQVVDALAVSLEYHANSLNTLGCVSVLIRKRKRHLASVKRGERPLHGERVLATDFPGSWLIPCQ